MKITLDSARSLVAQIDAASAKCSESLSVVRANEGLGELEVYAKLVGLFLGHSYTNILAPIWDRFPELEPESFKEPYQDKSENRVSRLNPKGQLPTSSLWQFPRFLKLNDCLPGHRPKRHFLLVACQKSSVQSRRSMNSCATHASATSLRNAIGDRP